MGGFYMQYLESKSMAVESIPFFNGNHVYGTSTCQKRNWLKGQKKVRLQGKRSPHVVTDKLLFYPCRVVWHELSNNLMSDMT